MKKITIQGKELSMRMPKVKDIRAMKVHKKAEDKEINLIANLCDLSPSEIDELDYKEYEKLQEALKELMGK